MEEIRACCLTSNQVWSAVVVIFIQSIFSLPGHVDVLVLIVQYAESFLLPDNKK